MAPSGRYTMIKPRTGTGYLSHRTDLLASGAVSPFVVADLVRQSDKFRWYDQIELAGCARDCSYFSGFAPIACSEVESDREPAEMAEPELAPPLEPDPAPEPRSLDVPKLDSPEVGSFGEPSVFFDSFPKFETDPESIPGPRLTSEPGPLSEVLSSAGTTPTDPKPSTTVTVIATMCTFIGHSFTNYLGNAKENVIFSSKIESTMTLNGRRRSMISRTTNAPRIKTPLTNRGSRCRRRLDVVIGVS
jgi:hypothetical protein